MTIDVISLFAYKSARNRDTHKDSLNKSETASASELSRQLRDALELLCLDPDQPLNFAGAFERCARWVYRRTKLYFFYFLVNIHQTCDYFIDD